MPDFVSQAAEYVEQIPQGLGLTLCLKTCAKTKLHHMALAQRIAAKARIIAELCDAG